MNGYTVLDNQNIEPHITFIRIEPTDINLTLGEVFKSMSDISWINDFDKQYIRDAFTIRAKETIKHVADSIIAKSGNQITKDSGEIVVSELSRLAIVNELNYLDIPLAELFKSQASGNDGFDFYSKNLNKIILFGEAKFLSDRNAYGKAFNKIVEFVDLKQDASDLEDIDKFYCEDSLNNHSKGNKGFMAAFASKNTSSQLIINGIKANSDFAKLKNFDELICIAVNV
ncbi:hypothetical protein [Sunxiuqinia elliptica]|uniref:Anti-bacteriophage protein A/HamA C-terminal domain-containing protein n=1 Tax=Sunxiuqinia elliptica TaxID=655355 RepID=A0A1I2MGN4_9BACT|nr:hypothetical protein [Sunxiuqinia elliptica]SFF90642.1 hypothetical protein SAMN05216283_1219 [Sunxiuqinia elliptica]